ncbi:VanZ family protein [Anaerobacillus isosaccharinicus]|uniref:VanZ family protein n=1 Tax=Anaerobacillus isosaccharinicus TaxID=1532552 RepID=A0A1S2LGL1_9BACI|nr:VanZ family protein [Anaerobacillus isosaccharinicus]MBA5587127.1 VanZ family protein [Anaerobacillus isosaccharinicus]QOY34677.1 VanZ family protein [Anaerobacillus isosaccharinicus]
MEQLWRAFNQVIPIFLICIPFIILIGWFLYYRKVKAGEEKKKALIYSIINIFLVLSIIGILMVTMLPGSLSGIQLVPFVSSIDVLFNSVDYTVPIRILGFNVVLFIPFGVFMALRIYSKRKVILLTTLIGMLLSIIIEFLQYALAIGRISNIDDVILNSFGAFLGAIIGYLLGKRFL